MIETLSVGGVALSATMVTAGTWWGIAFLRRGGGDMPTLLRESRAVRTTGRRELFVWSEKYLLDIPPIDQQHKTLVELINRLNTALKRGVEIEEIKGALDQLIGYTLHHFSAEERLIDRYGYPGGAAHRLKHRKLEKEVMAMFSELEVQGKTSVTLKLMQFLKQWLQTHILVEDRAYADHIHAVRASRRKRRL